MIKASEALARVEEIQVIADAEKAKAVKEFCETTVAEEIEKAIKRGNTSTNSIPVPLGMSVSKVQDYLIERGYSAKNQWGYKNAYVVVNWDKPTA